jgi:hypothetical protein
MRFGFLIALAAVGAVWGCGTKMPQQKPTPPDMSALVSAYAHPTLSLDAQNIASIADARGVVGAIVDKARSLVPSIEAAVHESADQTASPQSSNTGPPTLHPEAFTGEGFVQVHRICPGWDPNGGPNEEANGAIDLTLGFTEKGIDPVVWGTVRACKIGIQRASTTLQATFDGKIQLHLGDNGAPFDALTSIPILYECNLSETSSGVTESLATDFRIDPSGRVEYRVYSGDLYALGWDDLQLRTGYRAANGNFTCDFKNNQCVADSGATLLW